MRENDRHREILERLMVRDQPARTPAFRLAPWLALLALAAVGVWVVQLPRQPVPTLGIWDLQDPQQRSRGCTTCWCATRCMAVPFCYSV